MAAVGRLQRGIGDDGGKRDQPFDEEDDPEIGDAGVAVGPGQVAGLRTVPVIFDPQNKTVTTYLKDDAQSPTLGQFATLYRNELTDSQRTGLLDSYFGNFQACFLFTRSVYCEDPTGQAVVKFPEGFHPVSLTVLPMYGADGAFIVDDRGDFYILPFEQPVNTWTFDMFEKNRTLKGFRSVQMLPGFFNAAVTMDGQLVKFGKISEPRPVKGYEALKFRRLVAPFFWSPRLNEI